MRFRKSITMSKGLKINFSKSGISASTGIKGLTATTGRNGSYINYGIPGTGIYDRKKIRGSGSKKYNTVNNSKNLNTISGNLSFEMDEKMNVHIYRENDDEITDEQTLRIIKSTDAYRDVKRRLEEQYKLKGDALLNDSTNTIEQFTRISERCTKVKSRADIKSIKESLKPDRYSMNKFTKEEPNIDVIYQEIYDRTISETKGLFKKKKAAAIAAAAKDSEYVVQHKKWADEMEQFNANELKKEAEYNKECTVIYNSRIKYYDLILSGDSAFINKGIESWLNNIDLPFEFDVQYQYDSKRGLIWMDLDLPEIEDLPFEKKIKLKSGLVKDKKIAQKELNRDYAQCVFGLAMFFMSYIFNISVNIKYVCMSSYTQRRNKDGDIEDNYIYSALFDRTQAEKTDLKKVNPIKYCIKDTTRCKLLKSYKLSKIEPYSEKNIDSIIAATK